MNNSSSPGGIGHNTFAGQTLFAVKTVMLAVILLFLLWYARRIILLAFAGLLLAIFLQTLASWLSQYTRLPYGGSVAMVVIGLLAIIGALSWLVGSRLADQFSQLIQALPSSLEQIRKQLESTSWGNLLLRQISGGGAAISAENVVTRVTGIASGVADAVVSAVVILFVGLYGAAQPDWYRRGLLHLIPLSRRQRTEQVLDQVISTLRWWLLGQLIAMIVVGVLTGLGLWLLGTRLPLAMGIVAFALEIVPNVGPFLSAIPAVMLAWVDNPWLVLWVIALYIGVHVIEGYILMPLIQIETIRLPPAVHIVTVTLLWLLAGMLGVIVAAPLVVTIIVLIRMVYVEDTLGDRSVAQPGDAP